jgi:putative SOS response-associated peptidase YedK
LPIVRPGRGAETQRCRRRNQVNRRAGAVAGTQRTWSVAPKHPKAMPVNLLAEDQDRWLNAPVEEAVTLLTANPSQLMSVA